MLKYRKTLWGKGEGGEINRKGEIMKERGNENIDEKVR